MHKRLHKWHQTCIRISSKVTRVSLSLYRSTYTGNLNWVLGNSSFLYTVNKTEQNNLLYTDPCARDPESCQWALIYFSPENRAVFTTTVKPLTFKGFFMAIIWATLLWIQAVGCWKPHAIPIRKWLSEITLHHAYNVCVFGGRMSWQPWARQADDTRPCPWPWHG